MKKNNFFIKLVYSTVFENKINTISCILINMILTILLISTNVIYDSLSFFLSEIVYKKIDCRTLFVTYDYETISEDEAVNTIKNINKHILTAVPQDYAFAGGYFEEFKDNKNDGGVTLKGCDLNTLPILFENYNIDTLEGFCIIPQRFYPNSQIESQINTSNYVNGSEYLGKKLTLSIDVFQINEYEVTKVGEKNFQFEVLTTYDSSLTYDNDNVCYISFNDIKKINDASIDASYNLDEDKYPIIAYVDEFKNNNNVISSINNSKYYAEVKEQINEQAPITIKIITDIICISLYIFSVFISLILFTGMIKKSCNKIALLQTQGYQNSQIIIMFLFGCVFLIIDGYLLGIIIFNLIVKIVQTHILSVNFFFSKLLVLIDINSYFYPLLILIIIPIILLLPVSKKINRIKPIDLWKAKRL